MVYYFATVLDEYYIPGVVLRILRGYSRERTRLFRRYRGVIRGDNLKKKRENSKCLFIHQSVF